MKKQRSASPSQAMPRSAPVSRTRSMISLRFSGKQRVGLVVGEVAVGRPVGLDQLELEALQQRPDHRSGHAVAAVDDDLQRPGRRAHNVRVDELQRRRSETPRRDRPPRGCRARPARRLAAARRRRLAVRFRSCDGRPGCRSRPTARAPPRAAASRPCSWLDCARRCTSARRPARAIRRGSRASRFQPARRRSHRHRLRAGPRDSEPTAPGRSGACRSRAPTRSCDTGLPASPPSTCANARPIRSAISPSICSP